MTYREEPTMHDQRGPAFDLPPVGEAVVTTRPPTAPDVTGTRDDAAPPPARRGARRTVAWLAAVVVAAGAGATAMSLSESSTPVAAAVPAVGGSEGDGGPVAEIARDVLPSVVQVQVRGSRGGGTGSGFVLDDAGRVLTNAHVVEGARSVTVRTADDRTLDATVLGADADADVAVLQVAGGAALQPLALGSSAALQVGEEVVAFGSPLGLTGTVTSGIVSALDRRTRAGAAIQTDAAINPGNSGGPLVDAAGRVVGVNTMIATTSRGAGSIGIGFAVPIDSARATAERLIAAG